MSGQPVVRRWPRAGTVANVVAIKREPDATLLLVTDEAGLIHELVEKSTVDLDEAARRAVEGHDPHGGDDQLPLPLT